MDTLNTLLEPVRAKYDLPALAASVIVDGEILPAGAVGVRKYGDPSAPVMAEDQFHLGSNTKAMTATLISGLVEKNELRWETTLAETFSDLAKTMRPEYRSVTIAHLLAHRSGLGSASAPASKTLLDVHRFPGPPRRQRERYADLILRDPPEAEKGAKYIYANANYVLLGVIAERVTNTAWEKLLTDRVFKPLGMTGSAGFGAMGGAPGKVEQPWQHRADRQPVAPGPLSDNPPALAPAGAVHASVGDWAKFVRAHLLGERTGARDVLTAATFRKLHAPAFGGNYAGGWLVVERPWAGGRAALTHAGSNTLNYCVAWLAPARRFAVLVATNQGGDEAARACDETSGALIGRFL